MSSRRSGRPRLGEHLGTLLIGAVALYVVATDFLFSARALHGSAVVLHSYLIPRSGMTVAVVAHLTAEGVVTGKTSGWNWHPRDGEELATVYDRGTPTEPVLDEFAQRHLRALVAVSLLVLVAFGEGWARGARRQSEGLDRRITCAPSLPNGVSAEL